MTNNKPIVDKTKHILVIDKDYTDVPKGHAPHKSGAGQHNSRKKPREKKWDKDEV